MIRRQQCPAFVREQRFAMQPGLIERPPDQRDVGLSIRTPPDGSSKATLRMDTCTRGRSAAKARSSAGVKSSGAVASRPNVSAPLSSALVRLAWSIAASTC